MTWFRPPFALGGMAEGVLNGLVPPALFGHSLRMPVLLRLHGQEGIRPFFWELRTTFD